MCQETFPGRPDWPCDRDGNHRLHRHKNVMWGTGSEVDDRHDDGGHG